MNSSKRSAAPAVPSAGEDATKLVSDGGMGRSSLGSPPLRLAMSTQIVADIIDKKSAFAPQIESSMVDRSGAMPPSGDLDHLTMSENNVSVDSLKVASGGADHLGMSREQNVSPDSLNMASTMEIPQVVKRGRGRPPKNPAAGPIAAGGGRGVAGRSKVNKKTGQGGAGGIPQGMPAKRVLAKKQDATVTQDISAGSRDGSLPDGAPPSVVPIKRKRGRPPKNQTQAVQVGGTAPERVQGVRPPSSSTTDLKQGSPSNHRLTTRILNTPLSGQHVPGVAITDRAGEIVVGGGSVPSINRSGMRSKVVPDEDDDDETMRVEYPSSYSSPEGEDARGQGILGRSDPSNTTSVESLGPRSLPSTEERREPPPKKPLHSHGQGLTTDRGNVLQPRRTPTHPVKDNPASKQRHATASAYHHHLLEQKASDFEMSSEDEQEIPAHRSRGLSNSARKKPRGRDGQSPDSRFDSLGEETFSSAQSSPELSSSATGGANPIGDHHGEATAGDVSRHNRKMSDSHHFEKVKGPESAGQDDETVADSQLIEAVFEIARELQRRSQGNGSPGSQRSTPLSRRAPDDPVTQVGCDADAYRGRRSRAPSTDSLSATTAAPPPFSRRRLDSLRIAAARGRENTGEGEISLPDESGSKQAPNNEKAALTEASSLAIYENADSDASYYDDDELTDQLHSRSNIKESGASKRLSGDSGSQKTPTIHHQFAHRFHQGNATKTASQLRESDDGSSTGEAAREEAVDPFPNCAIRVDQHSVWVRLSRERPSEKAARKSSTGGVPGGFGSSKKRVVSSDGNVNLKEPTAEQREARRDALVEMDKVRFVCPTPGCSAVLVSLAQINIHRKSCANLPPLPRKLVDCLICGSQGLFGPIYVKHSCYSIEFALSRLAEIHALSPSSQLSHFRDSVANGPDDPIGDGHPARSPRPHHAKGGQKPEATQKVKTHVPAAGHQNFVQPVCMEAHDEKTQISLSKASPKCETKITQVESPPSPRPDIRQEGTEQRIDDHLDSIKLEHAPIYPEASDSRTPSLHISTPCEFRSPMADEEFLPESQPEPLSPPHRRDPSTARGGTMAQQPPEQESVGQVWESTDRCKSERHTAPMNRPPAPEYLFEVHGSELLPHETSVSLPKLSVIPGDNDVRRATLPLPACLSPMDMPPPPRREELELKRLPRSALPQRERGSMELPGSFCDTTSESPPSRSNNFPGGPQLVLPAFDQLDDPGASITPSVAGQIPSAIKRPFKDIDTESETSKSPRKTKKIKSRDGSLANIDEGFSDGPECEMPSAPCEMSDASAVDQISLVSTGLGPDVSAPPSSFLAATSKRRLPIIRGTTPLSSNPTELVLATELQPPTPQMLANYPSSSEPEVPPPVKRGRGRPPKHPKTALTAPMPSAFPSSSTTSSIPRGRGPRPAVRDSTVARRTSVETMKVEGVETLVGGPSALIDVRPFPKSGLATFPDVKPQLSEPPQSCASEMEYAENPDSLRSPMFTDVGADHAAKTPTMQEISTVLPPSSSTQSPPEYLETQRGEASRAALGANSGKLLNLQFL